MIKQIYLKERNDGVKLYLTYSDEGKYIYKEGHPEALYTEAIDVEDKEFNYLESDIVIEHDGQN